MSRLRNSRPIHDGPSHLDANLRGGMTLPPRWFYRTVEPQVADYIGPDAAALWVSGHFWWAAAWILWVPVGLSSAIVAELPGSPGILWLVTAASSVGALALGTKSIAAAKMANSEAREYLSRVRGYRINISCPITSWPWQWAHALAKADDEHQAHVALAQAAGIAAALAEIVEKKQSSQVPFYIALGLIGFLAGFVLCVLVAFAVGQTQSLGVFLVFVGACSSARWSRCSFAPGSPGLLTRIAPRWPKSFRRPSPEVDHGQLHSVCVKGDWRTLAWATVAGSSRGRSAGTPTASRQLQLQGPLTLSVEPGTVEVLDSRQFEDGGHGSRSAVAS